MSSSTEQPTANELSTVRYHVQLSIEAAAADAAFYMDEDPAIDVVLPPLFRESHISWRCRNDWRGGDFDAAIRVVLTQLLDAAAIRPISGTVREALIAANDRTHSSYHPDFSDTWELINATAARRVLPKLGPPRTRPSWG